MVSFWPFGADQTSAASFEKTLSQLSTRISKASTQNDSFRQHQRRYKVLWTLYTTFAYILVALILILVTGYQRWSVVEYTAVAGGPVLIYGVRTALDAYYNFRLARSQDYLNDLLKQREIAIEKLKKATKYNSTQQLLDKYGGTPRKRQPSPQPPTKRKSEGGQQGQAIPQSQRTGFAPPPTANIQRQQPPQVPQAGARRSMTGLTPEAAQTIQQSPQSGAGPGEEFAPNAFSAPPLMPVIRAEAQQYASDGPKWYDRILDVVLGEDETQAKNRIALICQNCKLVNGQAPPGARTLEDVGRWRCSTCHAWNGVESEDQKILRQVAGQPAEPQSPASPSDVPLSAVTDPGPQTGSLHDDNGDYEDVEEDIGEEEEEEEEETENAGAVHTSPAGSTRSRARQRNKA